MKSSGISLKKGVKTFKTQYRQIKHEDAPEKNPFRFLAAGENFLKDRTKQGLGFYPADEQGKGPDGRSLAGRPKPGLGALIDYFNAAKNCPIYNMQLVHEVGWTFSTLDNEDVTRTFGAEIDPFGMGKSPPGILYVQSTMPQTGETNAAFIACAVLLHLEPEPFSFTALGNAWTVPSGSLTQPISPNAWTDSDRTNGVFGAAVADGDQTYVEAMMEHGWWMNYAFWHLARGYRLRWSQGRHTNIFDDLARYTAYTPTNAQEGSASSSEVDILDLVARMNDYYESLGASLDFLKVNRIRTGFIDTLNAGTPISTFRVSRDLQKVGVTYGGVDLRSLLRGNSEYRKLAVPYMIDPGVPIGMILNEDDSVEADTMRRQLDITQGQGGSIPPLIKDANNITAGPDGGATPQGVDLSDDPTPVPVAMSADSYQALYKSGEGKLRLGVVGFEMTKDQWLAMNADSELRDAVTRDCGVCFCG
jgi:hypothetical protein